MVPCDFALALLALHILAHVQLFCQVHLSLLVVYLPQVNLSTFRHLKSLQNKTCHSLAILVILLPRPRNPSNGELASKILRMASYLVRRQQNDLCILAQQSLVFFLLTDSAHFHNRGRREIKRQECCCPSAQPSGLVEIVCALLLHFLSQSSLDLLALMEIWPVMRRASPVAKRSLLYTGAW